MQNLNFRMEVIIHYFLPKFFENGTVLNHIHYIIIKLGETYPTNMFYWLISISTSDHMMSLSDSRSF